MKQRKTGSYERSNSIDHFIPYSLPPKGPPLEMTPELVSLYGEANFAIGQLNAHTNELSDPERFIKASVIKEALLSSAIEGVHTTLLDVFTRLLIKKKIPKETQLVLNYTQALDSALKMITQENLPLVNRVILRAHKALMTLCNEEQSDPGNFRKQSVRVGNLIPPPAKKVPELMKDLEQYINVNEDQPPLIRAGLAHVQFETIHPFIDGNGRIGRMLIVLMLVESGLLTLPVLYPSYYFKKHHANYYRKLDAVRTEGDFEGWLVYYLKAIRDSSRDAYLRIKDIEQLEKDLSTQIQKDTALSKMGSTAYDALRILFRMPVTSTRQLSEKLDVSYNTASKIISHFLNLDILSKLPSDKKLQLFRFDQYLTLLEKEYNAL